MGSKGCSGAGQERQDRGAQVIGDQHTQAFSVVPEVRKVRLKIAPHLVGVLKSFSIFTALCCISRKGNQVCDIASRR